ncbi:MAG: hypothetical protein HQL48_09490, partial [Gammaproteobacteria bacterium]|nr:hypothetical protein [Gammaproteobacteria bacterium]
WAGSNLTDGSTSTRWLSSSGVNDLNYSFSSGYIDGCYDSLDLTNYGSHNRSLADFILLTSDNTALAADSGASGWTPITANTASATALNVLNWGQGGAAGLGFERA